MKKRIAILTAAVLTISLLLGACGRPPNMKDTSAPYDPPSGQSDGSYPSAAAPSAPGFSGGKYDVSGESYLVIDENNKTLTEIDSTLTFSLKVDTASYNNVERYIKSGNLPPKDAVRTEELLNYFRYDTALQFGDEPFSIYAEVAPSPFDADKYLAFVRVKTQDIDKSDLPGSNLTFLIDSSGSMSSHDKLPLLKDSFALLVDTLREDDIVSIVTYAGESRIVLDSVSGADKRLIMDAINRLRAGGSTAGGKGIMTAYELAEKNFLAGGNNRVILATDGDFNVGVSSNKELSRLIKEKAESGVYLSILGFGMGNIRDDLMETLSRDGNGNYNYISSLRAAQKVLVDELTGNLFTVADDVKAQVEFNPENVRSFRLIGYENRIMSDRDFADDTKDAGEIGAGNDVIILFEIELYNPPNGVELKYQSNAGARAPNPDSPFVDELFEVRIRYKDPGESWSKLITFPVKMDNIRAYGSTDFNFACSVAAFSDLLRGSEYAETVTPGRIISIAEDSLGRDSGGYRAEFLTLLNKYRSLKG